MCVCYYVVVYDRVVKRVGGKFVEGGDFRAV